MTGHWQKLSLGDLLQSTENINPVQSPEREFDYIDVSSVSNETFQIENTQRIKGANAPSRARKLVRTNDILFATIRPTLQRIAVVPDSLDGQVCSTGYFVLRPKATVDCRFLFHYLFTKAFTDRMEELQRGASYPAVTDGDVRAQTICVPPREEQKRIVRVLDEAFEAIAVARANAEKNLQNARAMFASHVASIFSSPGPGWVRRHLREVCDKITDGTHQTPRYFEQGTMFLSSKNVKSGKIDWDEVKYIDEKQHREMHKRVAPRLNDILLAKNGTTGIAAIVDRDVDFDIYVSLALLRPKADILPHLLLRILNSPVAKDQFNRRLKGIGVPNLHLEEIREVVISFPKSLAEQKSIADRLAELLEETQRLARVYERKVNALDELKKSLLHQAFTGKL